MLHENICANLNSAAIHKFILTDFPIDIHCEVYPDAWTHYARIQTQTNIQLARNLPRYKFTEIIRNEIICIVNGQFYNLELLWNELILWDEWDYLKVLMISLYV